MFFTILLFFSCLYTAGGLRVVRVTLAVSRGCMHCYAMIVTSVLRGGGVSSVAFRVMTGSLADGDGAVVSSRIGGDGTLIDFCAIPSLLLRTCRLG